MRSRASAPARTPRRRERPGSASTPCSTAHGTGSIAPIDPSADRFFDYSDTRVRESGTAFAFLAGRPAGDWERIAARCESRRFDAGATIVAAGEVDRSLLIHIRGTVGVVLPDRDGRHFKEIVAPSVLGEVAFLDGGPRSVTLVALDECEALRMTMGAFEILAAHDPELGRAILLDLGRILAARLRIATDMLASG